MLRVNKRPLAKKSRLLRYAYYLFSSCQYKSYAAWLGEGEPNPFVKPGFENRQTHRLEIQDIFGENLR